MKETKNIFVINGSASQNSSSHYIIEYLLKLMQDDFNFLKCQDLKKLPHFDPDLSTNNPPVEIIDLRNKIEKGDGILVCTPEYIYSIPSSLKNLIEWCIATTVFTNKPIGIITASTSGEKAHVQLQLMMKTVMANFTDETTLLIQGVKGKINEHGQIIDEITSDNLKKFAFSFVDLVKTY